MAYKFSRKAFIFENSKRKNRKEYSPKLIIGYYGTIR